MLPNRRRILQNSGMGLGMLGLSHLLADPTRSQEPLAAEPQGSSLRVRPPHFAPKAKRMVHFFLNGGPSHVDTFDPKPKLQEYAGKPIPMTYLTERRTGGALPSPFKFNKYGQSGLEISELFEKTAAHADHIAVIRSMVAQVPNHEPSLMLMNCGDSVQSRPSLGSWLMYGLGTENQNLPGFIAMCPGGYPIKDTANWQSGFLPGAYQGTLVIPGADPVANIAPRLPADQQRLELDLLEQQNRDHLALRQQDPILQARLQTFQTAFGMQMEVPEAFNFQNESDATLQSYGL
ncbi:MAG: DUF1501 domain-containing protein, partial [Pirellula sp.]